MVHVMWGHKYPIECLDVYDNLVASGAHQEVAVWDWRPEGPSGFDLPLQP